ncbi:uncharacterized protein BdWA1_004039, partial [Babesia duncani]
MPLALRSSLMIFLVEPFSPLGFWNVEFCIQELNQDLSVKFENRVLSLDSGSDCKLKVSLHAKINLVGVKWAQPDTTKENGDPEKGDSDPEITVINSAYNTMLDELISPDANSDSSKTTMDKKRKNIIDAIKDVCQDCCCNRKDDEYCVKPTDISQAVKQVCANCCCKQPGPCVDSSKIMNKVKELCQNCCCKQKDCCGTEGVENLINKFACCILRDVQSYVEGQKGNNNCQNTACKTECCNYSRVTSQIAELCPSSDLKTMVQTCINCNGGHSTGKCCCGTKETGCNCCKQVKEKLEGCDCTYCQIKDAVEDLKNDNCCPSPLTCCNGDANKCVKASDIYDKVMDVCGCKTELDKIKTQVKDLCKQCNQNNCCDASKIQSDIQDICNDCDCKQRKDTCCNETQINEKVKKVIKEKCTCKKNKCCFNGVQNGTISNTAEQTKLKNIAKNIFKYFRPPIAHETGVMTLKSTTDIELEFLSSSSNEKITVDTKNKNVLKIPKQAFKDLMASFQIPQVKVTTFHKNTMLSIHFEEISLTFQKLNGTGFEIDGYPINGTFLMQLGYQPIGPYTKNTANWRNKTSDKSKHDLSWSIDNHYPQIDKNKCSCSILSNPLFGTVFGAICLTISIVQFIIALFVSQGYYDGFQSYMDAVRSGFSWPTQYDNVVSSIFCGCFLNAIGPSFFADDFSGGSVQSVRVLVGTQNVNGTSFRQVEFCIEQLEKDLSVKFENRVLSLDSKSVCKLKVSLAAKIVLYGVKWAQPDVSKENGDPDKNGSDSDSDITDINSAHNKMLEQLVTPTINNLAITNNDHKAVMDKKRKNIIDAIKAVCKDCCCNMTAEQYCIQPTDISEAVKQVCANCCCKNKDPCVDSSKIMEHVNKLCVDCCCKKQDCCNTKEVLSQIGDFCVCVIKEAKEKLENCTCDKCSSCKENCIDKGKLMKEIEQLCSCDKAKKVVENSAQNCDSCKGSGGSGCQCCQEAKKQFESCSCMACDLKRVIDDLQGSGENGSNKCCNNSSCPCSSDSDSNCRTKEAVLSALNAYCKCKDQVKQIKEKINGLCKHCNKNKCCDVTNIQSDIEQLCNSCPCKTQKKCCNENEIKSKVQQVIEKHCTCKKNKCCFNGVQNGDLSNKTDEQTKLKKIALTIFKYFRPPIAYTTGLMTLKSKTDIDLDFSSNSSSDDKITVDTSKNSLKIPKKAFQTIMASSQIVQGLVIVYHPNSMMSINFEEIILSFPKLCNEGFKIDGFPIHHDFSMKIQYGPAGPYTRPTANWRNKNSDKSKHELSWSLSYPQIDKNKCSCSILSDPLFGTVFGAICLTISIVQFIIALFVSQGYYDGFQSYMDAVRSGFSWPTQYDNVVSSIFWWLGIGVRNGTQLLLVHINTYDYFKTSIRISISPTLGTYEAVRVQVGTQNVNGTSFRQVEFCIEQLEKDLSVKFENRVLSLDSKSVCKLKVSLAAKIVLYGVKWAQPDVSKENGDPDKNGSDSDSDITDINSAHNKMLEQLVTPTINNLAITNNDHKAVMDKKRKNIIDAIKAVCKDCCCNRAEDYCIKPTDIVEQIKQVCASCCCKSDKPCVDSGKIMDEVNKLCVDCCCKKQDCCNTKEVLSQIGDFCVCVIKEAKEKLENCTCDKCSSCKENCIDKTKLMKEILKLCSCDNARIQLEEAAQNCDSCKGSGGSCQCCQEIQKKFKDCPCMACNLKRVIDEIQGSGENGSNCCDSSSCSCSSDSNSNCRKRTDVLKALNAYCKCKDQVKQIKEKIEKLCKQCNKNTCCDSSLIQNDIQKICNSCPCKQKKCCNESEINKKVQQVIESSCKCRVNKCCFRDITDGDLSSHSKEQAKLKNIAKAIFKYFRPPIAYETGVMTLESTTETELEFSSGGDEKITVDTSKNVLNTLKIPKQAFKDLMASAKMHENKVKDFHPNSMMSIEFHGITLTFCTLSGEGFKLDGYPIKGGFSMKMEYAPAGIFTRSTALWRKKNSDKHDLSWDKLSQPQIDPSKCSCSILSDPLFGTVFGAICLTISIVQFIIALFISQGYYDGFQSYMDAVRSGFSWPTQYDNVVNSVFWQGYPSTPTLGTYEAVSGCFLNAIGPSFFADDFSGGAVQSVRVLVGTRNVPNTQLRNVEFCIQELNQDLSVKFENRVLSLDSGSDCKLKVSLHAKINLVGVKWAQPDTTKDNGDPDKNDSDIDSGNKAINSAYNTMLEELVSPDANSDSSKKSILDAKRKNIIEAIKDVCKDCCCNRNEYCIQPTDISEAVKQVCASCCCKNKDPCVDSSKIMDEVKKLCQDCCCKKDDCCNTEGVLSQIEDFCVCLIKEAKEKLENCTCSGCSTCQENCIDKQELKKEILKLCSCSEAKKVVEQAAQNCSGCSGGSGCECCEAAKKQFESCPCMACDLQQVIDEIKGSGENGSKKCCSDSSCPCSSDSNSNCRTKDAVLDALKTYCKCDTQVKQIKEKVKDLCKQCNKNTCCDSSLIQSAIQKLCNSCPCKTHPKCCNENEIKQKVKDVIEKHCTCKKNKCCFRDITDGDLSSHSAEQNKLKNIALAIFKYFRPPIAHSTGLMTLKSTADIDLQFSSGSSNEKITVDTSKNVLKIPKQAFKDLMACTKIHSNIVTTFHKNTMLSIHFEEISLTFQKLNGTGFEIDGYPINGTFSMQLGYQPIGPFTKNSANMRKKTENEPKKHDLSWSIDNHYPQIDKNKCSCSILSDPLFGTVFGAICLTISIVQFIIALFVSQGYYDGFQSYMDAVRSGFSWPTQYDNVASSIFCGCFLNAIGPSFFADAFSGGAVQAVRVQVASSGSSRQVDFSIEQIGDLSVKFENRVLSLDSGSDCKLKVSLHAKINLVGVKWAQPDVSKENGDPEKGDSDSEITVINSAHNTMLDELISPDANSDSSKKSILDAKRQKIIEAIKEVCKSCCCNRKEDEFCIKPDDVSKAVKQVCANCCCKSTEPCVDSSKIMDEVKKLCVDCCCKKDDCCGTKEVLSQIGDFCVCVIKEAKEKLENCTCSGCSSCQENCIDKQKLMKEIEQLCSCDKAKKVVEQAPQKCSGCSGSGSCQCCEAAKKQFESCPCMACNLKKVIDDIKQEDGSNCCSDPSCSCSSGSNCRKRTDVLSALNAYCKCKDQVKQIKEKIEKLCKQCNKNTCCDSSLIQNDIQKICNSCPCKQKKCCNESEIKSKVQQVIESSCKCR